MRILNESNVESLKLRGYFKKDVNVLENNYDIIKNLNDYKICPIPYLLLFNGLDTNSVKNLIRFIILSWQDVALSLDDELIEFQNKKPNEICKFFLEVDEKLSHRVYFFIEIIYQYFFP